MQYAGYAMRERAGNQDLTELRGFLDFIVKHKVRRYLEVGCRNGDTFYAVMRAIGFGGFGLAIDLAENSDTRANLTQTVMDLRAIRIGARAFFGNSHHLGIITDATKMAPFDLVLIDADHEYTAVKLDAADYGSLAPMIAFHDVAAPDDHMSDGRPNGVGRFWREQIAKPGARYHEIIKPGSKMGFGIILKE